MHSSWFSHNGWNLRLTQNYTMATKSYLHYTAFRSFIGNHNFFPAHFWIDLKTNPGIQCYGNEWEVIFKVLILFHNNTLRASLFQTWQAANDCILIDQNALSFSEINLRRSKFQFFQSFSTKAKVELQINIGLSAQIKSPIK